MPNLSLCLCQAVADPGNLTADWHGFAVRFVELDLVKFPALEHSCLNPPPQATLKKIKH